MQWRKIRLDKRIGQTLWLRRHWTPKLRCLNAVENLKASGDSQEKDPGLAWLQTQYSLSFPDSFTQHSARKSAGIRRYLFYVRIILGIFTQKIRHLNFLLRWSLQRWTYTIHTYNTTCVAEKGAWVGYTSNRIIQWGLPKLVASECKWLEVKR